MLMLVNALITRCRSHTLASTRNYYTHDTHADVDANVVTRYRTYHFSKKKRRNLDNLAFHSASAHNKKKKELIMISEKLSVPPRRSIVSIHEFLGFGRRFVFGKHSSSIFAESWDSLTWAKGTWGSVSWMHLKKQWRWLLYSRSRVEKLRERVV